MTAHSFLSDGESTQDEKTCYLIKTWLKFISVWHMNESI